MRRLKNWLMRKLVVRIFAEVSTTTCANKVADTITLFDAAKHYGA